MDGVKLAWWRDGTGQSGCPMVQGESFLKPTHPGSAVLRFLSLGSSKLCKQLRTLLYWVKPLLIMLLPPGRLTMWTKEWAIYSGTGWGVESPFGHKVQLNLFHPGFNCLIHKICTSCGFVQTGSLWLGCCQAAGPAWMGSDLCSSGGCQLL